MSRSWPPRVGLGGSVAGELRDLAPGASWPISPPSIKLRASGPEWADCSGDNAGARSQAPLPKVDDRIRTGDRLDHNQELYQLSYVHRVASNLA
jgi:hypothetical protein